MSTYNLSVITEPPKKKFLVLAPGIRPARFGSLFYIIFCSLTPICPFLNFAFRQLYPPISNHKYELEIPWLFSSLLMTF